MPIAATDRITRGASGLGQFAVAWESDLKVSHLTVPDLTARDQLPEWKRLSFMNVYVVSELTTYRLGADITIAGQTWTAVNFGVPDDVLTEDELFDSNGFIKPELIQNIFLNSQYVVDSEAAMLALTTLTGNFIIRTDTGEIFVKLNNDDPATLGDFAVFNTPASVISVNGQTGAVNITITSLLAVPANVTAFNSQVGAATTGLASAISVLQGQTSSLQSSKAEIGYVDSHVLGDEIVEPDDDAFMFWDSSDGTVKWLKLGSGFNIAGGVVSVTGGGGGATDLDDLQDVILVSPVSGQGLVFNGVNWVNQAISTGGVAITDTYGTIALLLGDQASQLMNAWYMVQNASADPTVDAGWAIYQYLGVPTAALTDYLKIAEEESLDVAVNDASPTVKGIAKLYANLSSSNTDGAVHQAAIKTYVDAKVADAINNGVTDIAPSQNAVFDALALKLPITDHGKILWDDSNLQIFNITQAHLNQIIPLEYAGAITVNIPTGLSDGFCCAFFLETGAGPASFVSAGTTKVGSVTSMTEAGSFAVVMHEGGDVHVVMGGDLLAITTIKNYGAGVTFQKTLNFTNGIKVSPNGSQLDVGLEDATVVTVSSVTQMESFKNYISDHATLRTPLLLPATCAIGTRIRVRGKGAGLWRITQNANQKIYVGSGVVVTTTGVTGNLESTTSKDCIELECIVANTDFVVTNCSPNFTPTVN